LCSECCIGEGKYPDKECDSGYDCKDNVCVETEGVYTEDTNENADVKQPMNFTMIITIVGGIFVAVLVIVYVILKRKKKPKDNFEELYQKYKKGRL
jgi:plastocyanin domain-containing protein